MSTQLVYEAEPRSIEPGTASGSLLPLVVVPTLITVEPVVHEQPQIDSCVLEAAQVARGQLSWLESPVNAAITDRLYKQGIQDVIASRESGRRTSMQAKFYAYYQHLRSTAAAPFDRPSTSV